jgi:hypothetical protein
VRRLFLSLLLIASPVWAQEATPTQAPSQGAAPIHSEFHVLYVNGVNVYIDGGRDAGLAEGTKLVLKQDPTKSGSVNAAVEPGVVARMKVIAIASTSAVCEVEVSGRDVVHGDVVSLPDSEVAKMVEKNTLGNTRQYPMVISFTDGDPLDEEARDAKPRPPLPEVNQIRGRIGFDVSTIREVDQGSLVPIGT